VGYELKTQGYELKPQGFKLEERAHRFRQEKSGSIGYAQCVCVCETLFYYKYVSGTRRGSE